MEITHGGSSIWRRTSSRKFTKRNVLSETARLYDPLGLLGPVIVKAKMVMQAVWESKVGWDEEIPRNAQTTWAAIREQLPKLNEMKFERKVVIKDSTRIELHGFCDASERAYGGCVYIRSTSKKGEMKINLLCAKSRVAPLRTISLSRLELCAALLLSRLINTVTPVFMDYEIARIFLWSDSTIVLNWIKTEPYLLKTFVANRIAEIQSATAHMELRHVPSEDNAADVLSRGQLPEKLLINCMWKTGPEWLQREQACWPTTESCSNVVPQLRPVKIFHSTIKQQEFLTRFSTFKKLVRVSAYILRYCNNLKAMIRAKDHNTGKECTKGTPSSQLELVEIELARKRILQIMQLVCFREEIKRLKQSSPIDKQSPLQALNPFIDGDQLIRVGGRLDKSDLSYEAKYPVVLPKNHRVTELIVEKMHQNNKHAGALSTLNAMRERYWTLNGKNTVKRVIRRGIRCFREKPTTRSNIMGELPRDRVIQARPFLNTGIDFCGPFFIKEKKHRNRGKLKIYGCIFVCFVTKAIHIELVTDLSTDAFLASLRRFFARRGHAANLYCDNATNFVGAKNELNKIKENLMSESSAKAITAELSYKGIKWYFSPPRAPHFGGLWEAAVKPFKYYFRRNVGDSLFTYEELETFLIEIEAILNSRPITLLSNDPNDLQALTPSHFLIGERLTNLPEQNYNHVKLNRLSTWQHIQYLKDQF